MAKLYCDACNGCGDCCRGMGDTIHLDPYDISLLTKGLHLSFDELLAQNRIALHEENGMVIPHLYMNEGEPHPGSTDGSCSFLGLDGRCTIHELRPGFCRLFPLGRNYDAEHQSFSYFVIDGGCDMPGKMKMKISKWLGVPELRRYEHFVSKLHFFTKEVKAQMNASDDPTWRHQFNMFLLKVFYVTPYDPERDFYEQFELRLREARTVL